MWDRTTIEMFCSIIWLQCLRHPEVRNSSGPKTCKSQFLLPRKQASSRLPHCTERSYTDATERCAADRLLHLSIVLLSFLLQYTSLLTGMMVEITFASDKCFVLDATGDWRGIQYQAERGEAYGVVNPSIHETSFRGLSIGVFSTRWLQKLFNSLFCEPNEAHRNKRWAKYQTTGCLADGAHSCHCLRSEILNNRVSGRWCRYNNCHCLKTLNGERVCGAVM
jgi:hypothetical protein